MAWPGKNNFLFGGRVMVGPNFKRAIVTFFLITVPVALTCSLLGEDIYYDELYWLIAIYIGAYVFTILFFWYTCTKNPGYIPKQVSPFAIGPQNSQMFHFVLQSHFSKESPLSMKFFEYPMNGKIIRLKYCTTCMILRPPRTSHCHECDLCVEGYDHHCPWVANCIGKLNYKFFIPFLFTVTILCGTNVWISGRHIDKY